MMLTIPIRDNFTVSNMEYTCDGQFSVHKRTDKSSWENIKYSYVIEDIAKAIENYFKG